MKEIKNYYFMFVLILSPILIFLYYKYNLLILLIIFAAGVLHSFIEYFESIKFSDEEVWYKPSLLHKLRKFKVTDIERIETTNAAIAMAQFVPIVRFVFKDGFRIEIKKDFVNDEKLLEELTNILASHLPTRN